MQQFIWRQDAFKETVLWRPIKTQILNHGLPSYISCAHNLTFICQNIICCCLLSCSIGAVKAVCLQINNKTEPISKHNHLFAAISWLLNLETWTCKHWTGLTNWLLKQRIIKWDESHNIKFIQEKNLYLSFDLLCVPGSSHHKVWNLILTYSYPCFPLLKSFDQCCSFQQTTAICEMSFLLLYCIHMTVTCVYACIAGVKSD